MPSCCCRRMRCGAPAVPACAPATCAPAACAPCAAETAEAEPMCIHPSPLLAAESCPCLPAALLARLDAQEALLRELLCAVRTREARAALDRSRCDRAAEPRPDPAEWRDAIRISQARGERF